MSDYKKILDLAGDERVELGKSLSDQLGPSGWLRLGMSNYVVRNGSLSDGHEKITDAQRYAQALKETYHIAHSIAAYRAQAKEAQADLMDAEEALGVASKPSERLRAEAKIEMAQSRLQTFLVQAQDSLRQLAAFDAERRALEGAVTAAYPQGLESAEEDNWSAVARYRAEHEHLRPGKDNMLTHVPLPAAVKAQIGAEMGKPELMLFQAHSTGRYVAQLVNDIQNIPQIEKKVSS